MLSFIIQNKSLFFKNRWIIINLVFSLLILIGHVVFLYTHSDYSLPLVPLHYNIYFGIDYFGEWYKLFTVPLVGLVIFIVNNIISFLIIDKEEGLAQLLIGAGSLCQIILFIPSIALIYNI